MLENQGNDGIFVCDLKYRDFVDLDFVSSQLGTVVNTINLVEKLDNLSKHDELTGLWNRRGFIDKVQGYMNINKKSIPEELRDAIITAYGEEGIEKPTMTVEQLIYKLDNQEITKAEASEYLGFMLEDAKELMTRRYEEKEYSKLEEIDSTYTTVKEREEERAKVQNEDEIDR